MSEPIYLDYMATTPVDPQVVDAMVSCLGREGSFGNPASRTHCFGWQAAEKVKQARQQVAALVNAAAEEIIWTSGATESNNLALKGAAYFYQRQGKHIITMASEHKAVLDTCDFLSTQGFEISYLKPQANGLLDIKEFAATIRPDTILASIMQVNNETGVIQDIAQIGEIAHEQGVLFHVDAAQSAGKIAIDLQQLPVDLMSFSAHKIYGPKGAGALFVRQKPRLHLLPQIHGGGHEKGLRSGTLATQQIVGMGEAFAIAKARLKEDQQHIRSLREQLWQALQALGGAHLNAESRSTVAGALNVYFDGVDGEALMLGARELAMSSGSACNSANPSPSHVLLAMGLNPQAAHNSVRISIGRFTTATEIERAIDLLCHQVKRLRSIAPA